MPQRIVIFGPQGSATSFSAAAHAQALDDVRTCPAAAELLAGCHQAFVKDAQSLAPRSAPLFGRDGVESPLPRAPEELLSFPTLDSVHPIIEGSRLCLLQLLRHIRMLCQHTDALELSDIIEVAGCCSGLLPAVAVAASASLDELIQRGVSSFRLAFWIGYYSWLWCQDIEDVPEPNSTWSLLVRIGQSPEEDPLKVLETSFPRIRNAGLADDGWCTFSGPSRDIAAFRDICVTRLALPAKLLRIHGCFHGGSGLQESADKVCRDVLVRRVDFPDFEQLKRPLRSPVNGEYLSAADHPAQRLLTVIVGLLLVRPFDWVATSARIADHLNDLTLHHPRRKLSLDSVGPGSRMLVDSIMRQIKPGSDNLVVNHIWSSKSSSEVAPVNPDDIAIIGMAVDLPGSPDVDQFWNLIKQGLSTVQTIPESRFDVAQFSTNANVHPSRTMKATHGNFLDDIWSIDSTFFKISPREAKTMDPQQKILLRTVKSALEDAGYVEDSTPSFQRESFGCYVGVATSDYTDNLRNAIDVYYSPGTLRAFLSGKVSYHYRLSGPSVVTDTACSSSTVALYQACRALRNGDCTTALAGGVNAITSPDMYLGLDRGHFLNSTGQCKPFDAGADGYSRAEGCGMFVLKRLSDAVAENDRIHGIIKAAEINQSGCSRSITHPDSSTQASLLRKLLCNAGVERNRIDVIEAHGTGTQAGDVAELRSLHGVFNGVQRDKPIMVSSVKGNIGHCEAASGAAGLAKLLLMFRHGEIPIQASLRTVNPAIAGFLGEGLSIPRKTAPWDPSHREPRRAILNNFGAAGSNAALLVEEYIPQSRSTSHPTTRSALPFVTSTSGSKALMEWLANLQQWLTRKNVQASVLDICYTATARRPSYDTPIAISCKSVPDLVSQVEALRVKPFQNAIESPASRQIFVFSGQGGTYPGMGEELLRTCPFFRRTVLECDVILRRHGFPAVMSFLSADVASLNELTTTQQLVVSQCACVVVQYALSKLYISWNIMPECIVGHSLGEFAALAVAGVISLEDCLRLAAGRAQAVGMQCKPESSGMLACRLHFSDAERLIKQAERLDGLEIACINGPQDCVVAGPLGQLKRLAAICSAESLKTKMLDVPYGFHSAAMDPILSELEQLAADVRCSPAAIPVYSSVLGNILPQEINAAQYFVAHARRPVKFVDALRAMEAREILEHSVFIEIGPHPITMPLVSAGLSKKPKCLASLRKGVPAWVTLSETLVDLSRTLKEIRWRKVFDGTGASLVDLPGHPLSLVRTGVDYVESTTIKSESPLTTPTKFFFELRGLPRTRAGEPLAFETSLSRLGPLIAGHKVGGTAMCPASVLAELVFEAVHLVNPPCTDHVWKIRDMKFHQPLIYSGEGDSRLIRVTISSEAHTVTFTIESSTEESNTMSRYCEGIVELKPLSELSVDQPRHVALVKRQRQQFTDGRSRLANFFQQGMLYDSVFARVVEYSQEYRSIRNFSTSPDGSEGYGAIHFPSDTLKDFVVAPVVSDTLLHAAGFVANVHTDAASVYICSQMDSMVVLPDLDLRTDYTIYCSLLRITPDLILADSFMLGPDDRVVAWAERIHFQRVRLASFRASLERACKGNFKDNKVKPALTNNTTPTLHASQPSKMSMPGYVLQQPKAKIQDVSSPIIRLVADACDIPETKLDISQSLDALGIDSMLLLELSSAISKVTPGITLNLGALDSSATLEDLIEVVRVHSSRRPSCEPTPPMSQLNSSVSSPKAYADVSEIYETLVSILTSLCGISAPAVSRETPLNALGIDSMMLIELQAALEQELEATVTMDTLSGCTDIRALENALSASVIPSSGTPLSVAFPHITPRSLTSSHDAKNGSYSKTPCFLFHDGSGLCSMYERLTNVNHPMWGLCSSTWSSNLQPDGGLVEMARIYASSIDVPEGGVIVGGWSFGGVVAFEVARQLAARGAHVKGVILIDSPHPVEHVGLPAPVIDYVLLHHSGASTEPSSLSTASRETLATRFRHHASLLQAYRPTTEGSGSVYLGHATKAVVLSSRDPLDTPELCGVTYPWLSDAAVHADAARQWQQFFERDISIRDIPGTHFDTFSPHHIAAVSEAFTWALREIEQ